MGGDVVRDKFVSMHGEATVPPAQLPSDIPGFHGRQKELSTLDELLAQRDRTPPGVPRIAVITGTAGSGKTTLAVHWAHSVVSRFDGGHLYVDMKGYTPGNPPLRAVDALARFLRALAVSGESIVDDEQECAARYRSEASRRGLLIVLDNVRSVEQVRPLLPANRDCLVLVTSRECLSELVPKGALLVEVGPFDAADSFAMLSRTLPPDRVATEPGALARLGELCGHLPLALALASGRLVAAPGQSVAEYADDLTAGDRLTELAAGDASHTSVRAAFDVSFRGLPKPQRRLFSMLGLLPGSDFTAHTAAAINSSPLPRTRGLLHRLVAAHLVQQTTPGRYQLHDLLRLYAAERAADQARRTEAEARLLRWYLCAADAAGQAINAGTVRLP
ncbi:MAG TPA: NB-ARC domain-containing protein, partial [Mycobacteriales bacterium]|nr:NB-ARC domain-containing protein [Mycobacteriales bacterium]